MTIREAIDRINQHKEWGWTEPTMRALDIGINALEKQIPKKPKKVEMLNGYFKCPMCGYFVVDHKYNKYCGRCGQAILWEDD